MSSDDPSSDHGATHGATGATGKARKAGTTGLFGAADGPSGAGADPGAAPDVTGTPDPGQSRGRLAAVFGGLAVLGLITGIGAAELVSSVTDNELSGALTSASPTPSVTESVLSSAAASAWDDLIDDPDARDAENGGPTATPTSTATATAGTGTPNYRPIAENPEAEPGLDFGYLTRVVRADGTLTLRFDRASYFTGAAARQRNAGKPPPNDYLIENTNPVQRTFELDPKASIVAASRLRNQPGAVGRETLTVDDLLRNAATALASGTPEVPVWLRHTDGLSGPVTALAEQYLP